MAIARIVWVMGSASVVFVGTVAGLEACGSSSAGGYPVAQDSGSHADTSSGGSGSSSGSSGSSSGSSSGGGSGSSSGSGDDGGTCEDPPTLYVESKPGVYCPFSTGDAGKAVTCAAGQHCCETPESAGTPSTCEPMGTACPVTGSIDWQCEEAIDCTVSGAAGPICCGTGSPTTETSCGVTWPEWTGFTGTKCATSCPAPGITVCEQQSDCTTGTCTASKADGNQFGFCM
jgi:hypothetical protein